MEVIQELLEERNARETIPFVSIIESNVSLNSSLIQYQRYNTELKNENNRQKEEIEKVWL